jgi:hypothetical protein
MWAGAVKLTHLQRSLDNNVETITKWGLRRLLFLVSTPLHLRVPTTKCRAQIIV